MQFVVAMAAVGEGVLCSVVEFLALVDGVELPGPMLQQALGHGLPGAIVAVVAVVAVAGGGASPGARWRQRP